MGSYVSMEVIISFPSRGFMGAAFPCCVKEVLSWQGASQVGRWHMSGDSAECLPSYVVLS